MVLCGDEGSGRDQTHPGFGGGGWTGDVRFLHPGFFYRHTFIVLQLGLQ